MPEAFAFVTGGAVQAAGGIYLERDADRDLLRHCLDGDFTYVLTSRQMGKTSLMYRAAERLVDQGALPVIIDLTGLGADTTAEQWYKGFLLGVQEQLGLGGNTAEWWDAQASYSFAHRLTRYLREVALVERSERVVVFVDEIDTTLRLDFTDDFFAAIRFLYQSRALDPELRRLSFVLIGVATPNDLIKDPARTPFNIGRRVELTDFTDQEASALAGHLAMASDAARDTIARVLRWTGGHPYLTMRVLRSLVEVPPPAWTDAAVDARIHDLFLGPGGESDTNLQFVRDMLTKKAFDREAVLRTYETIRGGGRVADKELDQIASWLKLSGIVCRRDGLLRVRNAIYERVFDERWAREHRRLHVNWRRRLARAAAALLVVIVLVTIPLAIYALQQKFVADVARRQAEVQRDEAQRQRDEAMRQLLTTERNLQTAQEAVEALRQYDPKVAATLSTELTSARAAAETELKSLAEERERLRLERDDAVASLQKATRENAALRDQRDQQRAPQAQAAAPAPQTSQAPRTVIVDVPDVVGRPSSEVHDRLSSLGLRVVEQAVDADAPRGTIVSQAPSAFQRVPIGTLVQLAVSRGSGGANAVAQQQQVARPPVAQTAQGAPDEALRLLRVLQRYKAAYEALDATAVAAVYPAVDVKRLQAAFDQFSRLTYDVQVHVDGIVIAPDRQTATVTASETYRPVARIGGVPPQGGTAVFTMRKVGETWTIESVKSNTSN